jgi:hypothetical protein
VPFETLGEKSFGLLSGRIHNPDTVQPLIRIRGKIITRDTA